MGADFHVPKSGYWSQKCPVLPSVSKDWLISALTRLMELLLAMMNYMENWDYILFGHTLLSLTLNLIKK